MAERIGIALGSGGARGWSHIGVLQALEDRGLVPDIVAGTSMGAVIGAAYAGGQQAHLAQWARGLRWHDIRHYLDFSMTGGLIRGGRVVELLNEFFQGAAIDDLPIPFGAVATDLERGRELWLREGRIQEALHASIAVPGLFAPVWYGGRWVVDGGLVNPVPVALSRAMGADYVIAVDLNADLLASSERTSVTPSDGQESWVGSLRERVLGGGRASEEEPPAPAILGVLQNGLHIMQTRISRSRMAGDPPDALITPRMAGISMMEFHRAADCIDAGFQAVQRAREPLDWLQGRG